MGGNNDDDNKNHSIIGLRNLANASAAQKLIYIFSKYLSISYDFYSIVRNFDYLLKQLEK